MAYQVGFKFQIIFLLFLQHDVVIIITYMYVCTMYVCIVHMLLFKKAASVIRHM